MLRMCERAQVGGSRVGMAESKSDLLPPSPTQSYPLFCWAELQGVITHQPVVGGLMLLHPSAHCFFFCTATQSHELMHPLLFPLQDIPLVAADTAEAEGVPTRCVFHRDVSWDADSHVLWGCTASERARCVRCVECTAGELG